MSNTGLPVFDATVQETNLWLKSVMQGMHTEDRQRAYLALRATLHALRDRIGPEPAVHLAAQLPLLLRGVYFEGWRLASSQSRERHPADFFEHVREDLPKDAGIDINLAVRAVFATLDEKLDPGEVAKVMSTLPAELETLWPRPRR